ncbi:hypothetical protein EZV62_007106 [Acer yangbiense]|uniref:Uncharacterized protein n=1 Tax=Acer yangbiense TaxID=1000413 RepID=A0A5C7I9L5_9ROSI|nr:hypothetical protein EZV62_007106 [Acer yangbiense]
MYIYFNHFTSCVVSYRIKISKSLFISEFTRLRSHAQEIRKMKFVKPLNLFKEMRRIKPSRCGRLLGLCINDKHVDLAMSDSDNISAVPLSLSCSELIQMISKHNLTGFVVDYPHRRSFKRIEGMDKIVTDFINDLCKTRKFQGLKYTYWTAQIATKHMDFVIKHNVEFILENLNLPNLEPKEMVDKFVAARLLQVIVFSSLLQNLTRSF